MKKLISGLAFSLFCFCATAQSTKITTGYYKPTTGTYVQPYTSTRSNTTNTDNFSTSGNSNPYSGTSGSRAKDYSPAANNYKSGQNISTGPRGGQSYTNSNGNKVYVPKRSGY